MTILWFRRDLRINDNALLSIEGEVLPIFIFDTSILNRLKAEDRRVNFIFDAVMQLKKALRKKGLDLALFYGAPQKIFQYLLHVKPESVCASGDYDAYSRERDRDISMLLPFKSIEDTYIFSPEQLLKKDGTPYLVFTPFYNQAKKVFHFKHLKEKLPENQTLFSFEYERLLHVKDDTVEKLPFDITSIGFKILSYHNESVSQLLETLKIKLPSYTEKRDIMAEEGTSALSVHLRFGTLGIRELLRVLLVYKKEGIDTEPFFRQLIFREFYAYLLFHFPDLTCKNFRYHFNGVENRERFEAFCCAKTGVPIVDAGVMQLLQTGHMHNRVRMICASFFTKDLLLPWQWGEAFFAEYLFDYDAASNILSWQWSAGTGVDPQPYFRIFNPYLQSKKFDPEAHYIKKWLPQLRAINPKILHDEKALHSNSIRAYPKPIVDHKRASQEAKRYFKENR